MCYYVLINEMCSRNFVVSGFARAHGKGEDLIEYAVEKRCAGAVCADGALQRRPVWL